MDTEGEKLQEPMDSQDCFKILFSGRNIYISSINSQHLQLSTQTCTRLYYPTSWHGGTQQVTLQLEKYTQPTTSEKGIEYFMQGEN